MKVLFFAPAGWLLLLIALANDLVDAVDETPTMTIEGRLQYPDRTPFNTTTRVIVNHGEYTTYSRRDGNFTIHGITPGIYLIDVHSPTYHFSQVKCLFKPGAVSDGKPVFSCLEYLYPGAPKQAVENMLVLNALATYEYFEVKRGFSVFSILKNPMVLLMAFTVGFMYLMPMMMENLEPEERERMQKQMEMQQNPTKMLGELFGGFTGEPEAKPNQKKIKK
jgi:ER membrane protein complex subunit 7